MQLRCWTEIPESISPGLNQPAHCSPDVSKSAHFTGRAVRWVWCRYAADQSAIRASAQPRMRQICSRHICCQYPIVKLQAINDGTPNTVHSRAFKHTRGNEPNHDRWGFSPPHPRTRGRGDSSMLDLFARPHGVLKPQPCQCCVAETTWTTASLSTCHMAYPCTLTICRPKTSPACPKNHFRWLKVGCSHLYFKYHTDQRSQSSCTVSK